MLSKIESLSLFIALLLFSFSAIAQTNGCYSSGSGYIYTDRDGLYMGVNNYKFDDVNDRYLRNIDVFCANYGIVGSCRVTVPSNSNADINGYPSIYGQYVTFTTLQCPIDDYIPYILLSMGGLGFIIIQKTGYKNLSS